MTDQQNPFFGQRAGELRRRAGHDWQWVTTGLFRPHWRSTSGKDVIVFPPHSAFGEWTVGVRQDDDSDGYCTTLSVTEKKAFAFAERLRSGAVEVPPLRPES